MDNDMTKMTPSAGPTSPDTIKSDITEMTPSADPTSPDTMKDDMTKMTPSAGPTSPEEPGKNRGLSETTRIMTKMTLFTGPMSPEELGKNRGLSETTRICIRPQSIPEAKIWLCEEYRIFEKRLFQLLAFVMKDEQQTKENLKAKVTQALMKLRENAPSYAVLSRLMAGVCALRCDFPTTPVCPDDLQEMRRFLVRDAVQAPPNEEEDHYPWGPFRHCEDEAVVTHALFAGGNWFTSWAPAIEALVQVVAAAPGCEPESRRATIMQLSNGVLLASDFVMARARHMRELSDGRYVGLHFGKRY